MTHRENFLRAVRRESPECVPFWMELCPSLKEELKKRYGTEDVQEAFDTPIRYVGMGPTKLTTDFRKYFEYFPEDAYTDEWGVGYAPGSVAHFATFLSPMKNFETPEEVAAFPEPDFLEEYRWEPVRKEVKRLHEAGYPAVFSAVQVFEPAWYLRGLENLLSDMLTDEEMAEACIGRVQRLMEGVSRKAAESGCDAILFGDDVATQRAMMMSVPLWRKWLKPAMEACIAAAKAANPGVIALYHSDGVVYDIVEELIGIGVDVLNPVQPECVEPALLKEKYGQRLSFYGCVGTQTVMPFGTAEDVRKTVRELFDTVGKGGGLLLCPTHMLEPEVPWENIEAFVETARELKY